MNRRNSTCLGIAKYFCLNYDKISKSTIEKPIGYEKNLCGEMGLQIEKYKNMLRYRDCYIKFKTDNNGPFEIYGIELKKCKNSMPFDNVRYAEMLLIDNDYSDSSNPTVVIFYNKDAEITDILVIDTIKLIKKLFVNCEFKEIEYFIEKYKRSNHKSKAYTELSKKVMYEISSFIVRNDNVYSSNEYGEIDIQVFSKNNYLSQNINNDTSTCKERYVSIDNDYEIKNTTLKNVEKTGLIDYGKTEKYKNINNRFTLGKRKSKYEYRNGYKYVKKAFNTRFECSIRHNKNGNPIFHVKNLESGKEHIGNSATSPWNQFCNDYKEISGAKTKINGPLFFGLRDKEILKEIEIRE